KWETSDLITFDNKDKYARISKNNTGRKIRFEFNRINAGFIKELEEFIKEKLKVSE
ncbi:peptide transporter, partial [Salmonella enterica]|nr:peptide transporter [Salmonella enterica]